MLCSCILIRLSSRYCRHYPLSLSHGGGVLSGDRLVCPFHASCFNVETGDVEDGPSMSGLPIFETRMAGGDLYANLPVTAAGKLVEHREPCRHRVPPAGSTPGDVVVIGSGAAAAGAIETLLAGGHSGSVTVISKDRAGFWDRIKVSKAVTETDYSKKHVIIDPAKWEAAGVKLMLGYEVTTVDAAALSVSAVPCGSSSADAVEVRYDKLICASGGPARTFRADKGERFTIDGADLSNIFVLRDATDNVGVARALDEFADAERAARVVVVGSSFIGMEAAASLMSNVSDRALQSIDIIGMEAEPFERVLGLGVGRVMRRIHQDKAQAANDEATAAAGGPRDDGSPWFTQTFHMRSKTLEFEGSGGLVTGVRISTPLPSGGEETRVLPADIVVIGAGMIPATDYLSGTPAVVRNGVRVDATLKACDHIWAAGDIAEIPNTRFSTCDGDAFLRIEHWDVAIDQGRCAARNVMRELAGKAGEPFDVVPFFWTQQHGTNIRYAGHAHFVSDADTIIRGDMDAAKPKLIAFYCSDKKVSLARLAGLCTPAANDLREQSLNPRPALIRGEWATKNGH